MKYKVTILHRYLAPYRIDLYNKLAKVYDLDVILAGSKKEINGLAYDLAKINDLANFKYKYYFDGIRLGRHLISLVYYKHFRIHEPAIVFVDELGYNTLFSILFKKKFNFKIVNICDDSPKMAKSYNWKRKILRKFVIAYSDVMLVVNKEVRDYLSIKYANKKCEFVYFPILQDDERLALNIKQSNKIAKEYITRYDLEDSIILLFVGRFDPVKDIPILLEAFSRVYENNKKIRLILIGDGSLKNEFSEWVLDNNLDSSIIFTGKLSGENLYAWYYLAQIFILPSKHEPFGAVVNEALVAGCYVITSNAIGANSLINKINGNIFESGNVDDLSLKIKEALELISIPKKMSSKMEKSFDYFFSQLTILLNNKV